MAEVFTKYVFDTTEASASLGRFKQEVRELQGAEQSSQKTFQTNAQKRAQLLKEEQEDLRELKRRRDQAYTTKEISLYNKRIAETEKRVKNLKGEYGNLEKSNRSLVSSFQRIGAAIGVAFGIREILTFTKRAAELAAEAEGVRTAFERVGGTTAVMQDLQRATRGTVDQLRLMNRTVQASNFNIPIEQMSDLFEFATNRAIELGEPIDNFVNRIIDGIGRKSIRVLDDLGFSLAELQEEMKTTGDFAQAAANIISREMEEMGDIADTNAVKIQRSQAALKDATISFGDVVAPVYANVLDLITKAIQGFTALSTGMSKVDIEEYGEAQERLNREMEGLRKAAVGAADAQDFYRDRLEKVRQEIIARGKADATLEDAFRAILTVTIQKREATEKSLETDKLAAMNATQYTRAMIEQIPVLKQLLKQTKEGNLATEESVPELRTLASIQEEIKEKQERMNTEVAAGSAEFHKLNAEIIALTKEMESYFEAQKTLLEQLEDISGIKPNNGMEEFAAFWRDFFSEFGDQDMPFEFEQLEEMDAMLDDLSVEDKIESITRSIERLKARGADPDLVADLEANLDKLKDKAKGTSQDINDFVMGLLEQFVFSTEDLMVMAQDAAIARLDELLEAGEITQAEYDAILKGMAAQLEAFRASQAEAALASGVELIKILRQVYTATTKDAEKSAKFLQTLAIFQILIEGALAVASAIRAAAQSSQSLLQLVANIAIAVGTVVAGIATVLSQAKGATSPTPPTFAQGGEIQGKPHTQGGTHIEAEKGEYVVKSSAYAKAKEAVQAINAERFDTYVTKHYIEPLLKSKQLAREDHDRGFARNIAESLHLDGKAEHYLKQIARKGNNARIENFDELARLMRKDNRGSTY